MAPMNTTTAPDSPRRILHSLGSLLLVTAALLLGASSNRPPLPKTVTLLGSNYFSHLESMQNGGKELFAERIETRLPKYKGLIQSAAGQKIELAVR